jgi:hypothetical protein
MIRVRYVFAAIGILMAIGGFIALECMGLPNGRVPSARTGEFMLRMGIAGAGMIIALTALIAGSGRRRRND